MILLRFFTFLILSISINTAMAQNKSVIGFDSRYKISEHNRKTIHDSIGLILVKGTGFYGLCTGTVISPRHVITAAHCLVENSNLVNNATFYPGLSDDPLTTRPPFGKYEASYIRVPKKYLRSFGTEDDFGVITFSENLPVSPVSLTEIETFEKMITIAGFPSDKKMGTMWEASGERSTFLYFFGLNQHSVDTMSGESGAAMRVTRNGMPYIVGIHSAGMKGNNPTQNFGLFFNENVIKTIQSWIDAD